MTVARLEVHRQGTGPPLLLLHGLGSSNVEFCAVLPVLAGRYDVLALDLPGHGGSAPLRERPDLPALTDAVSRELDAQGVQAPHVLGVSLGGRIGLELARRSRARSVVALAPVGPLSPPERAYQVALLATARLAYGATARWADLLLRSAGMRTAALAPLRARGWTTSPQEAAELVRAFAGAADFWRVLRCAVLPELRLDYSGVRCPVRIAQGTHDVLTLSQALWLTMAVPGARYDVLPLAGHSSVADVPQSVVRLVDEAVAAG